MEAPERIVNPARIASILQGILIGCRMQCWALGLLRHDCQGHCGHKHTTNQGNFKQRQVLWTNPVTGRDWGPSNAVVTASGKRWHL